MASWEHRDSQLNHLHAERGLAKLSLPGEQSLLKFTISTLCRLQMKWQGWHLGHSWWRGHPQSLFLLLDLALLATPSAPAFCWKSLEGLWTDLCSSLPSLLTFCVAWRKPLGSCKSQFPREQDVELTALLQEWDSMYKGCCQLSTPTPVDVRTFDILSKSSCKEWPCVVYSVEGMPTDLMS